MRRLVVAGVLVAALAVATWPREDDHPVDPATPEARRAAAVATEIVRGRVLGVTRDEDNGKWEVQVAQSGRQYEVELDGASFSLLRLDYD